MLYERIPEGSLFFVGFAYILFLIPAAVGGSRGLTPIVK